MTVVVSSRIARPLTLVVVVAVGGAVAATSLAVTRVDPSSLSSSPQAPDVSVVVVTVPPPPGPTPVGDRLVDVLDAPWLGDARWPVRFQDVDHDRVDELVTLDRTWESSTDDDGATYSHDSRPHAEFVVEFLRGGGMVEDGRSPHVARQLAALDRQMRLAARSKHAAPATTKTEAADAVDAGAADDDVRALSAAGALLSLELGRANHDVAGAVRRFRARVAALHIDAVHAADVAWIEQHALAVDAQRQRPPVGRRGEAR